MNTTPRGLRLHISFFGRRNVGKSSLLNALTRQQVSIVSPVAGTTTDPVEKPMELLPLGPVLFTDTAGIDDAGALGKLRVEKTRKVLERTDLAVLVCDAEWGSFEEGLLRELREKKIPVVIVFNKSDLAAPPPEIISRLTEEKIRFVRTCAAAGIPPPPACPIKTTAAPAAPNQVAGSDGTSDEVGDLAHHFNGGSIAVPTCPIVFHNDINTTPTPYPLPQGGGIYRGRCPQTPFGRTNVEYNCPIKTTAAPAAPNQVAGSDGTSDEVGDLAHHFNGGFIAPPASSGIAELRQALLENAPAEFIESPALVGDLVGPGELAVLVVPLDKEAPKGRLILPQVQAIRDLLDSDSLCVVVKERELKRALELIKTTPKLVVTDSQAFPKVAADTPPDVPLTSFSILMARFKGDLTTLVEGALAIEGLKSGDKVLVAEACTHHPVSDDIGRVKIPRWLTQYAGGALDFVHTQGTDFPSDLRPYKLVVHCGGCMWNRRQMLSRIQICQQAGVPITNYGLTIAYSLGIFERALSPFPAVLEAYRKSRCRQS
jgi:small GTP-binding protein